MKSMKIFDDPSIQRSTKINIAEGLRPSRVVLRKVDDAYQPFIVHRENLTPKQNGDVLEFHHAEFYWGHYFTNEVDANKDFEEASRKFLR